MGLKDLDSQVSEEKVEIKNTESTGFDDFFKPLEKIEEGEGAKILIYGGPEVGKTFFGLSCPEPIVVVSTEFGVKKVAHHFEGKKIFLKECNIPFGDKIVSKKGVKDETPFRVDPISSLRKVEAAADFIKEALDSGRLKPGGTILIDSLTDIWAWLSIYLDYTAERQTGQNGQEFIKGNEWTKINEAFRTLVSKFNILPMHVVLTCRVRRTLDRDGNMKQPDTFKAAKEANHHVDIVLHSEKKPIETPGQKGKFNYGRVTTIEKCRQQAMNNLELPDLTFDTLKEAFVKVGAGHVFDIKA